MSATHKGKKLSLEHRAKLSKAKKGKPSNRLGVHLSLETKAKMSRAKKGKKWSTARRAAQEKRGKQL